MDSQRLLIIANKTCPCPTLIDEIVNRAGSGGEVRIVAPALNSRLRHYVSDVDDSIADAESRLAEAVDALAEAGVEGAGIVGDADPLTAIEDELASYDAHEILISTHPPGESNWLAADLVERARERFEVPVLHMESEYGLVR